MRIPSDRLWIGSVWVPLNQELDLSHFGEFRSFPNHEIVIGPIRDDIAALTIIHEVFEAIADIYDLNLKETHIRCIEHALAGLIVRSPEMVDWVISELRKSDNACSVSTSSINCTHGPTIQRSEEKIP